MPNGARPGAPPKEPLAWQYLEHNEVHHVLARILAAPFTKPGDYDVQGSGATYEGIYSAWGTVVSKHRRTQEYYNRPHWYDEMKILLTDSGPQHVGFLIDVRELQPE